jgi:bisphosphoglycerate-dependent phosphoglycerate mutase
MDQPYEGKGASRFEGFGKKVDEHLSQVAPRIEEEVKRVISYLNDEVVPQLRQGSSQALRSASDSLRKLAEQLDNRPGSGAR